MAALDQVLKKHLFTPDYEAIHVQFHDDPSDLIREEGVNYEYEGKIWNVRILQVCDDTLDVKEIFIRIHSDRQIYGHQFSARPDDRIYDSYIEPGGSGCSGEKGNSKDIDHNYFFKKVITQGLRNDAADIPRVPRRLLENSLGVRPFFEKCEPLIPPHFDPPPPQPQQNHPLSSCLTVTAAISALATLYFGYRVIQNIYQYSKGECETLRAAVLGSIGLGLSVPILACALLANRQTA